MSVPSASIMLLAIYMWDEKPDDDVLLAERDQVKQLRDHHCGGEPRKLVIKHVQKGSHQLGIALQQALHNRRSLLCNERPELQHLLDHTLRHIKESSFFAI